jgi:hypothetical protein
VLCCLLCQQTLAFLGNSCPQAPERLRKGCHSIILQRLTDLRYEHADALLPDLVYSCTEGCFSHEKEHPYLSLLLPSLSHS